MKALSGQRMATVTALQPAAFSQYRVTRETRSILNPSCQIFNGTDQGSALGCELLGRYTWHAACVTQFQLGSRKDIREISPKLAPHELYHTMPGHLLGFGQHNPWHFAIHATLPHFYPHTPPQAENYRDDAPMENYGAASIWFHRRMEGQPRHRKARGASLAFAQGIVACAGRSNGRSWC